jgi:hypothetical protein
MAVEVGGGHRPMRWRKGNHALAHHLRRMAMTHSGAPVIAARGPATS